MYSALRSSFYALYKCVFIIIIIMVPLIASGAANVLVNGLLIV